MRFVALFCLLFLFSKLLYGEYYQSAIDTVFWFYPGKGQNLGQGSEYFPQNIFKLPDTNASEQVPSSSPTDICSIGLGGEICVGFKNFEVVDGDGPDFTIFENAFINPVTQKVFAEPAVVSVSADGINFVEFPWDYNTLEGCAGTKPTNGKANPFDPNESGGNSFDLSTIGLKKIKYIKIKDICDSILKDEKHPFYSPLLSGFDLDCVVGIHLLPNFSSVDSHDAKVKLEVTHGRMNLNFHEPYSFVLYNSQGQVVFFTFQIGQFTLNFVDFPDGLYLLSLQKTGKFTFYKILKIENEIFVD
jgi:hypothetical protein